MDIKFYFNLNFQDYVTSNIGGGFFKIACVLNDSMFLVKCTKDTHKTSVQKFENFKMRNLTGIDRTQCFESNVFFSKIMPTISDEVFNLLYECMKEMPRSFKNYLNYPCGKGLSIEEKAEVYKEIDRTIKLFENEYNRSKSGDTTNNQGTSSINEKANDQNEGWQNTSEFVNTVPVEVIVEIIKKLKVPYETVFYEGRDWRLAEVDGRHELQSKVSSGQMSKTATSMRPVFPPRKTVKMAFMTNVDGLTEFVKDTFYKILHENSDYIIVENLIGETRELSRKRFKIIDVYAEPPRVEDCAF